MSSKRSKSPEGQKIINLKNKLSKDDLCRGFILNFKNTLKSKLQKYPDIEKMSVADYMKLNDKLTDEILTERIGGFYDAMENLQIEVEEKPKQDELSFGAQLKEYFSQLKINESKSIFD